MPAALPSRLRPLAALIPLLVSGLAQAQGVATERELTPISVSGQRATLDPNLPTTTASVTREELDLRSFTNTEDALTYAPNLTIRKRYIGDRNALIGGRSNSTLQAQRGLVYVDGYLISNFLGRFNAPRWNIVSPEEVERVDVLYGPFSAIYPGNSIGTTVAISTRQPKQLEASARVLAYEQRFSHFGQSDTYRGDEESAFLGQRLGDFSFSIGLNRLHSESHPMQYQTFLVSSGSTALGGTPVSGARFYTDPEGKARFAVGSNSGALEVADQTQFKLRGAYDFSATLKADLLYARWRNDYSRSNETFLRDAAGNEVWSGQIRVNGLRYTVSAATWAPGDGLEEHEQMGARLFTRNARGWNTSLQVSRYRVLTDTLRSANNPDPVADAGGAGSDADGQGTGWTTFEAQATYTPGAGETHALTLGLHANRYVLENHTYALSNWRDGSSRTSETQNALGKTAITALYAQDAWRFLPDWTLTGGVRFERFKAFDGSQYIAAATADPLIEHASRSMSATSPKLSLSWAASDTWLLRASIAKGVRFPTVAELYQGSRSGTSIVNNDPNLKPEISYAKDLTAINETALGTLRLTLFEDDVRDTIYQQTNITVTPNVSNVQNVDRVRTRGLEVALDAPDFAGVRGLRLNTSVSLNHARTLQNDNFPDAENKNWVRVPRVRATLLASYESGGAWGGSVGVRYSGRQYNTLDNVDSNPDTYGGTSSYTVADAKLRYRVNKHFEASVGIDNLFDERYFVSHPYPGRTVYAEARAHF